ncbi:MAG: putative manganese-dependent inorganic diphosphatase [Verrucomicrobiota bacterium]
MTSQPPASTTAKLSTNRLLVIGHKNPDTDAICSALAYASFLRQTGHPEAVAACCGELNARTTHVLELARVTPPELILDVRPTLETVMSRQTITAREDESLFSAFNRLRDSHHHSMPVLSREGRFLGLVSMQKLVDVLLPSSVDASATRQVESNLQRIALVTAGHFAHAHETDREENFILTVGASSAKTFADRLPIYPPERLIVVTGDRPTVQEPAIEYGARAIIVTGGSDMRPDLLERAKAKHICVILSPNDTATTTLLIKCAQPITHALESNLQTFTPAQLVGPLRKTLAASQQPLFPVLDEDGRMPGVFSKSDLLQPPRNRLVLVDHNEMAQAVDGASEAEVVEVIDHHRLGGSLTSSEPIRFLNEPLGSTCTIVARMHHQNKLKPERGVALCLLAGIVSDTLKLTSPTTTDVDHDMVGWLCRLHQIDLDSFAEGLFAAGSSLQNNGPDEIVRGDCKAYEENGWSFMVAQVEELGFDHFWPRQNELERAVQGLVEEHGLDFAALLITDITTHDSYLLSAGDQRILDAFEYPEERPNLFHLSGVVSRKKQLLPALIRLTAKVEKEEA